MKQLRPSDCSSHRYTHFRESPFFWKDGHLNYQNLVLSLCGKFTESSPFDRLSSVSACDIFYLIADSGGCGDSKALFIK